MSALPDPSRPEDTEPDAGDTPPADTPPITAPYVKPPVSDKDDAALTADPVAEPVVSAGPTNDLDEVRALLFGSMTAELSALRERVTELEELLLQRDQRAGTVGEVLVESVGSTGRSATDLGEALTPAIEEAVNFSARTDSTVLAEALYPVMGPAMRRMIANMFIPEALAGGGSFQVQQVLLIERESGVLLAASSANVEDASDADVVSGMLDAIRLFVHEAFDTPEHDGLQDLRVGDTSVLVEWGPRAVLASVVRGLPTEHYRERAAVALETIHLDLGTELTNFDGRIDAFEAAQPVLAELYRSGTKLSPADAARKGLAIAGRVLLVIAVIVVIIVLLVWLL